MIKIRGFQFILKPTLVLLMLSSSMLFISCGNKGSENNTSVNQQIQIPNTNKQVENNVNQVEKQGENANVQNVDKMNENNNTPQNGAQDKKVSEKNEHQKPTSILIDAPLISQLPELKNGCEITSLTMMLTYTGIKVDKMTLAKKVDKDTTPITYNKKGKITEWGDPDEGFVGDMSGRKPGYSVDPEPLVVLVNEYMPNKAIDLTGVSFEKIQETLSEKRPIVVWVTCNFKNPVKNTQWDSDGETINATFSQHAVLLTGYDEEYLYYNDPLTNTKNKKVSKTRFIQIWNIMGKKALSYKN